MPTEAPATTLVLDEETVFRAVLDQPQFFTVDASGNLRLSGSAFNDRRKEPSVDRASMIHGGADTCRKSESDGVVGLVSFEVRAIKTVVTLDQKERPVHEHQVDVVHNPVCGNAAHAVVRTAPALVSDNAFRKLKEALCLLASRSGWAYQPASRRLPPTSVN